MANAIYDKELSEILTRLWNVDDNRCTPGLDYKLNLQGFVTATKGNLRDKASQNLFLHFNEDRIFNKPTIKAFISLLDNYAINVSEAETETDLERGEVDNFLSTIVATRVMKETHKYLNSRNMVGASEDDFKKLLFDIWFKMYKRSSTDKNVNSCGFEHVFVGEMRSNEIIGFHNWLQIYLQEKVGNLDYMGFFRRGTTDKSEPTPHFLTHQFRWRGELKPIVSTMIGRSPEFEMAMYTIAHLCLSAAGKREVHVHLDEYDVMLVVARHGHFGIGTAYLVPSTE
ncbi:hypothetical protein HELRODRAFT_185016 [Helobdella robusta]|uniref:Uridylate-specific endoribonuclease n=1 Tax=Helobdella robusta TaxID=6412 RepID=T1FMA1_HELRO|nr:hypothetical protein HELRODRAFT_185016 [Helobdella robusta]ESO02718.1 hypothetical protein HELRODRAFT_185016 [Helobdella robusta]